MLVTRGRRDRLDAAISTMAATSEYNAVVRRLGCGVSTLTGFALATEIGDWQRFSGRSIGAYMGLVPTESSSGATRIPIRYTPSRVECVVGRQISFNVRVVAGFGPHLAGRTRCGSRTARFTDSRTAVSAKK
jgi:hypothetical protein